jgi:hypothetical protein
LSAANVETPTRLLLDAGPLISFFFERDAEHSTAVVGFRQLARAHTRLIAPLPIVFEVYKWLLYQAHPGAAQLGLQRMRRSLEIVYPGVDDFKEVAAVLAGLATWNGTLEDALVALMGLRMDVPVWTMNYRDLAAFPNLHFWTPATS